MTDTIRIEDFLYKHREDRKEIAEFGRRLCVRAKKYKSALATIQSATGVYQPDVFVSGVLGYVWSASNDPQAVPDICVAAASLLALRAAAALKAEAAERDAQSKDIKEIFGRLKKEESR